MGKALYREYRPKSLDGIVGQKHITDTLQNALKKKAISHAYLFTGPRGVGKTSIARIWAHAINDIPYNDESIHLDIIEIDAASNRRIDEIRELRDKVHVAPTSARYKVYIIDEVHMLTREAFNAILKTLEEPPEHAVFILATTEAHKVPDTIKSRTQRYNFKPITNDDTVSHLRYIADKEKINITDEALELLAQHGMGSFRDSISMLDQISGFGHETITEKEIAVLLGVPQNGTVAELIEATASGDSVGLFDCILKLREQGTDPSTLARHIITSLRNLMIEQNNVFEPSDAVELMKNLLPLTATHASFEAIEIALLDALSFEKVTQKTNTIDTKKASVQPENKQSLKTESGLEEEPVINDDKNKEKQEAKNNVTTSDTIVATAETTHPIDDPWENILQAVKGTHNTLYGLLRMAEPRITETSIILTFSFEFHKKQLVQSKNYTNLQTIIEDTLKKPYELDLIVKKKKPKSETTTLEKLENDALKSVSNIFDGAELLES